jgi:RimJ/RimL family protein N-acetyltransferase
VRVADRAQPAWIVQGERIGLAAPRKEDFLARWEAHNDPALGMLFGMPSLPSTPLGPTLPPYTEAQHEALWECIAARTMIVFDVCHREDGRLIAEVVLNRVYAPHASCELSLAVFDPAERRQHFALEALTLVCAYAFDVLALNRVCMRGLAANEPLVGGLERHGERIGARRVGVEREALWAFGGFQDVIVIEILKRDFPPQAATAHLRR